MSIIDHRAQSLQLDHEELVKHMQTFELELKFSAGIWCFSPVGGRFHDRYVTALDIPARLDIAGKLGSRGLAGIEAHFPNEINEANLDMWKQFARDTGIRIVTVIPLLFFDADFEWGALSSPLPHIRQMAIERTKRALELNQELDTDFAVVWPGIDGYENPFGVDFYSMRNRFAQGLAEAMDAVPGVRVAFEPKPYEPRGHILYGTTAEGLLLCEKVESLLRHPTNSKVLKEGHALVGINPEVGHMLMAYEDLAYGLTLVTEYGRLFHSHWNSQPLGNYDQDQNVAVISPEQTESALYALKMIGYRGYFGIDINPERMPIDVALCNCMDALHAADDRINSLDHGQVLWATEHPDQARGWLEAYLIRARAPHAERLRPLPPIAERGQ